MHAIPPYLLVLLGLCGQLLAAPARDTSTGGCDISNRLIHQLIPLGFQALEHGERQNDNPDDPISIYKVDCELRSESGPSDSFVFCLNINPAIGDSLRTSSSGAGAPFVSNVGGRAVTCKTIESESEPKTEDIKLRCSCVDTPRSILARPWVSKFLIFAVIWVTGCTIRKLWVDRRDRRARYQATSRPEAWVSEKIPVQTVEDVDDEFNDSNYSMG